MEAFVEEAGGKNFSSVIAVTGEEITGVILSGVELQFVQTLTGTLEWQSNLLNNTV